MKKIITGVVGALVVVGAGVGLWIALDSTSPVAKVGKAKITASQLNTSVNAVIAERKTVSTTGMQLAFGTNLTAEQLNFYIISALLKDTAITERIYLQFRAELFNIWNHAQFLTPSGITSSASFGKVTAALPPRIGQLSLKLNF